MRWVTGAELALVLAFGTMLVLQANAVSPPPPPAEPTGEQVAAAASYAEQQAERVNGRQR
jgi:hypothetical protein